MPGNIPVHPAILLSHSLLLLESIGVAVDEKAIYEKKKAVAWKYDLGKKKNFEQVFGTNKLLWFLPLYTAADQENIPALQGLDFPTRSDVEV
ncbi:putative protein S-acyltransferase 12 [Ananas comosus]|uniref:Uncharacterized protein n=1 Tax=Ananas comosus TaxID=4615 RepID=A0A199VJ56_ANACO|nr:putative protein S-acyltransferase 12 [Ananas comosus]